MSQRPQPVTSKFRNHFLNDIYSISDNYDKSSSAGSTSSLTSVLHHESFDEDFDSETCNNTSDRKNNNNELGFSEKKAIDATYCKRIIARQPHYPGERVTLTKYDGAFNNNAKILKNNIMRRNPLVNDQIISKSAITKNVNIGNNLSKGVLKPQKVVRKIAGKSQSLSEHSDDKKRKSNQDIQSDDSYATDDFSVVSAVNSDTHITANEKEVADEIASSVADTLSVSINDPSDSNDEPSIKKDQSNKLLTAWEAWYLKKEKQKRKQQELILLKEKEKCDKDTEEKAKRLQVCHEKIKTWLIKKEEMQKKEVKTLKKRQEEEKNLKEQKKEESIKKSSEKYVAWKLEKLKRDKELEKQQNDLKTKLEAEKMIKRAKAANAFQRWSEDHKDHQMLVPYSYGISDGKLTSYYDKTSNPPPSFFNPDPWKPIIDIKN